MDDYRGTGYPKKSQEQRDLEVTRYLDRAQWLISHNYILDPLMDPYKLAKKLQEADTEYSVIEEIRSRIVPPR
jgi:hypothetical protein